MLLMRGTSKLELTICFGWLLLLLLHHPLVVGELVQGLWLSWMLHQMNVEKMIWRLMVIPGTDSRKNPS
jgi:hypothetical protein